MGREEGRKNIQYFNVSLYMRRSLEMQIKEQSKKMVLVVVLSGLRCLVVDIHSEPLESLLILLFYNGIYMTVI